ncbi:MAG: hypothetical protein ACE5K8_09865 [Candidatus Zixiibacteriota bacterium]
MKIYPIGIRSYQQLIRTESPAKVVTESASDSQAHGPVTSTHRTIGIGSRLAVQASKVESGNTLAVHERKALELILMKMKEVTSWGVTYGRERNVGETSNQLGRIIDVKV